MKKIFKKIIGFILATAMLVMPLSGTAMAVDEQIAMVAQMRAYGDFSGTYRFKAPYNTSLQIIPSDDVTYWEGTSPLLGSTSRNWILAYVDTGTYRGYYTIQDVRTRLYMTVNNSSSVSGTNVIFSSFTGTPGQYWSVSQTTNGNYKITPYCGVYSGVVLGTTSTASGSALKIVTYVNDADYKDEWVLTNVTKNVLIDAFYDNGYYDRYGINADFKAQSLFFDLTEVFYKNFGVRIRYTSLPAMIQSYADQCPNNYLNVCNCAPDDSCTNSTANNLKMYHHKNSTSVLYRLPRPDLHITQYYPLSFTVMLSGHNLCYVQSGNHIDKNYHIPYNGTSDRSLGLALTCRHDSDLGAFASLVHEVGHLLEARDHDGEGMTNDFNDQEGEVIYNDNCIYGGEKRTASVYENLMICDGCRKDILTYITYYFEGHSNG